MVFPAYAGMSLMPVSVPRLFLSFPRLRGDEPWTNRWRWWGYSFSPPTRG